jgi:hypothetical protein
MPGKEIAAQVGVSPATVSHDDPRRALLDLAAPLE